MSTPINSSIFSARALVDAARVVEKAATQRLWEANFNDFNLRKEELDEAASNLQAAEKQLSAAEKAARAMESTVNSSVLNLMGTGIVDNLFPTGIDFGAPKIIADSTAHAAAAGGFGLSVLNTFDNLLDISPNTNFSFSDSTDYTPYSNQEDYSSNSNGDYSLKADSDEYVPYTNEGSSVNNELSQSPEKYTGEPSSNAEQPSTLESIRSKESNKTSSSSVDTSTYSSTSTMGNYKSPELGNLKGYEDSSSDKMKKKKKRSSAEKRIDKRAEIERIKNLVDSIKANRVVDHQRELSPRVKPIVRSTNTQKVNVKNTQPSIDVSQPKEYVCDTLLKREMLRVGLKVTTQNSRDFGVIVRLNQLNPTLYVDVVWSRGKDPTATSYSVRPDGTVRADYNILYLVKNP